MITLVQGGKSSIAHRAGRFKNVGGVHKKERTPFLPSDG